ncbi:sulfite exporter TauE/SafE family protein [Methylophaga nitratireducenticrescens]|uniref:Probable membrane transporter protein n=1 Tax=Methylophaga nitratireducenticrescens TaxID=754476 RepID=I1XGL0_METNJ|nr:sulfite exporter TauE/SafE family protein [Methylophaga nitratireducenticrescens]AFI83529.1 anion permease [Methylophaga nitratireducenticrescens]AUZ83628.1 anion permease [Methylophaga nitratireducenticrescens]
MSFIEHFILFVISLLANTFSALSGGGAGLIQFPVLIFLGLTFSVALATHKVASVALGLGAALRYITTSRLERQFVILLLVAGLPGVVIGGSVILMVPDRIAEIALGLLTGSLGIYSVFKPALGQLYTPLNRERHGYLIGAVVLFFLGILNGSLTSGTGLFVTIWLILWFGMDYQRAVAYTLILVGLFWNGAGAITLGILGEIQWDWLPALLLGSLLGGYLGSHLALRWGNQWIKRSFEIVTLLIAIRLIWGPF